MNEIHPTAIVASAAELGPDVSVGAFSCIGPDVRIGSADRIASHVVVEGHTEIGNHVQIASFAAVGTRPQDLKYAGEPSRLTIGENTIIREHATLNPGTKGGGMETKVGANSLIMIAAHVAHDCKVGEHVILVNNVVMGGHVTIGDHVVIGGQSAIHQFVRIGAHAMVGGKSGIDHDVIPFGIAMGNRAYLEGINLVGMKRRGFSRDEIHGLRKAYRRLFSGAGDWEDLLAEVANDFADISPVAQVIEFLRADTTRALCRPARSRDG